MPLAHGLTVSIQSFGEKEFRYSRTLGHSVGLVTFQFSPSVRRNFDEFLVGNPPSVFVFQFSPSVRRNFDLVGLGQASQGGIVSIQSFGEKEFRSRWSRTLVYSVFQVPKARITLKTMIQPPQDRQTIRRAKGQTLS